MPKYRITSPDGRAFDITAPDGASQADVLAYAQAHHAETATQPINSNPAENVQPGVAAQVLASLKHAVTGGDYQQTAQNTELGLAGVGRGMTNLARGGGQLVGAVSQADIQDANKLDAPLMATTPGKVGSAIGTIAPLLPTAMIPGANTYLGSAAIGGGTGLLEPIAEGDILTGKAKSVALGVALSTAAKGAGDALGGAYQLGRDTLGRFTEQGSKRLAALQAQTLAGGADNLAGATAYQPATVGIKPTLAEATLNPGIASAELARSSDPVFKTALRGRQDANNIAIIKGLDEMRGGAGGIDAAKENINSVSSIGYDKARQADAMRRDLIRQQTEARAQAATAGIGTPNALNIARNQQGDDFATAGLRELSDRPAFQAAVKNAAAGMANRGNAAADPLASIDGLHRVKLAIDDMLEPSASNALGRNAKADLMDIKSKLVEEMGKTSSLYDVARKTHQQMNEPLNQMQVANALYNKFVPALTDNGLSSGAAAQLRANAYAEAVRKAESSIKDITGFDTTLEKAMTPEQMTVINGHQSDLARTAIAKSKGASAGSATDQNKEMNALMGGMASQLPHGNTLLKIGKALAPPSKINAQFAEMLLNPKAYAEGAQLKATEIAPMINALRRYGINPAMLGANAAQ